MTETPVLGIVGFNPVGIDTPRVGAGPDELFVPPETVPAGRVVVVVFPEVVVARPKVPVFRPGDCPGGAIDPSTDEKMTAVSAGIRIRMVGSSPTIGPVMSEYRSAFQLGAPFQLFKFIFSGIT